MMDDYKKMRLGPCAYHRDGKCQADGSVCEGYAQDCDGFILADDTSPVPSTYYPGDTLIGYEACWKPLQNGGNCRMPKSHDGDCLGC